MFNFIRETLLKWDPEGLISIGCPEDEYDSEAKEIHSRLLTCKSLIDVTEMIRDVFNESFAVGTDIITGREVTIFEEYTFDRCKSPAEVIWKEW